MSNPLELVNITIDNRRLAVEPGTRILPAAERHGIYIPTLCSHPELTPFGGCRLCLVEVEGMRGFPTACTTPVEEGMVIRTQTAQLQRERAEILSLILSEHTCSCLFCEERKECADFTATTRKVGVTTGCRTCPNDGQCELQDVVEQIGVNQIDYPVYYRGLAVEKSDPFFDRDYNLCILCGRCVRMCQEIRLAGTLAFKQRGSQTVIGAAFGRSHLDAGCEFCGACVSVCPTGALAEKTRKWDGKPEREQSTTCVLCGLGCELRVLVKGERVLGTLPSNPTASAGGLRGVEGGQLCVKGRFCVSELLGGHDRLKRPYRPVNGNRLPLSWEEAETLAVEKLSACSPERFGLLVSADCTNEDLYIAQKFAHAAMRSTGTDTPARAELGKLLPQLVRLLNRSVGLTDIRHATAIVAIGVDARFEQSVVGMEIRQAQKRGAKFITVNEHNHHLARIADEWLQVELAQLDTQQKVLKASLYSQAAPLIVLGPDALLGENASTVLHVVEQLAESTEAKIVLLPWPGNLAGALLMGTYTELPADLSVLYVVGDRIPEKVNAEFVILQGIYPPTPPGAGSLVLPAAAFTEVNGTVTLADRRTRALHQVVNPPGEALPHWRILCRIATLLGVDGFTFATSDEIWAEMTEQIRGFAHPDLHQWEIPPDGPVSTGPFNANRYQGVALVDRVKGFAELFTNGKR